MADASGSGGLGTLTLGAVAGVAVVLGGVVLFQLGVFGSSEQGDGPANRQAGGQAANGGVEFTGDGEESGQPLQNRALSEAAEAEAPSVAQQITPVESGAVPQEPKADEAEAVAAADVAVPVEDEPSTGSEEGEMAQGGEAAAELGEEETALIAPADPALAPGAAPSAGESKEDIFVLQAPELDLVRVDRDGAAVIAGRAQEGVRVSVLLDGEVLEQLDVPAGGEFVSLTTIAPSSDARVVTLLAEHDGRQSASGGSFILAPVSPVASLPAERVGDAADDPAETAAASSAPVSQAEADQAAEQVAAALTPAAETPAVAGDPDAPQPQGQAVAVLRADQDGIEVVQPAIPDDPELSDEVALDAISYNGAGGVELSGRARPKSRVRVYVDNTPVAELDAAEDGRWKGELADVKPGIYTLRVDEIEPGSGKVVSRLETPFKREAPEALPQPGGDAAPEQPAPLVRAVTVQKGDTLWAISQEKFGSGFLYVRVFEANRGAIRNPDLIYPGQVFTIPE